jgi:hypothetical protein
MKEIFLGLYKRIKISGKIFEKKLENVLTNLHFQRIFFSKKIQLFVNFVKINFVRETGFSHYFKRKLKDFMDGAGCLTLLHQPSTSINRVEILLLQEITVSDDAVLYRALSLSVFSWPDG